MDRQLHSDLTRRLARLERDGRRLRWVLALVTLAGAALVLAGAGGPLTTDRLVLKFAGKKRAELAMAGGAPSLLLYDESGVTRLAATAKVAGPQLLLYDRGGKPRAMMTAQHDGTPALVFYDHAGKGRLTVALRKSGGPLVMFMDARGKVTRTLP